MKLFVISFVTCTLLVTTTFAEKRPSNEIQFYDPGEWIFEDSNGSGIPNCRFCTHEFKKLSKPEQDYWMEIVTEIPFEKMKHPYVDHKFSAIYRAINFHQYSLTSSQSSLIDENWLEDNKFSPVMQRLVEYYCDTFGEDAEARSEAIDNFYKAMAWSQSRIWFQKLNCPNHLHPYCSYLPCDVYPCVKIPGYKYPPYDHNNFRDIIEIVNAKS